MKKVIILISFLMLTGCSNHSLTCKSSSTDEQGNISEIKYTFKYKKDDLDTVIKTIKMKVKDSKKTKFIYGMYGQTFNIFKEPGTEMSGSYNKDTIKILVKIDVNKIETVNEINSIAKMNYTKEQMSLFLETDGYNCK